MSSNVKYVIVNFDIPEWPWDERLLSAKVNAGNFLVQTQTKSVNATELLETL